MDFKVTMGIEMIHLDQNTYLQREILIHENKFSVGITYEKTGKMIKLTTLNSQSNSVPYSHGVHLVPLMTSPRFAASLI